MDPRHPELAIARMDELMSQFKKGLSKIRTETVANKIGAEERELSLVVQEICLVAPRLHEAMMQVSRTRRAAIGRGLVVEEKPVEEKKEAPAPKKKTTKKKKAE